MQLMVRKTQVMKAWQVFPKTVKRMKRQGEKLARLIVKSGAGQKYREHEH